MHLFRSRPRRIAALIAVGALSLSVIGPVAPVLAAETGVCTAEKATDPTSFDGGALIGQPPSGVAKWSGIRASITLVPLDLCFGTDPDSPDKSGDFVFIQIRPVGNGNNDLSSIPFAVPANYPSIPGTKTYLNYIALGYMRCKWTGDSSCGTSGNRYFASWS